MHIVLGHIESIEVRVQERFIEPKICDLLSIVAMLCN